MELLLSIFITTLLCAMLIFSPCVSLPTTDLPLSSSSHEQVEELSLTKVVVVLPRKLRVLMNEEDSMVKSAAVSTTTRDFKLAAADTIKPKKASPKGTTKLHNHSIMDGRKGTRQNWIEQSNSWQYFTMDYAHVRRRRPIHNMSIPRAP